MSKIALKGCLIITVVMLIIILRFMGHVGACQAPELIVTAVVCAVVLPILRFHLNVFL